MVFSKCPGKDIRQRRNAQVAAPAVPAAPQSSSTGLSFTGVLDSLLNIGSFANSCIQTSYMIKEYEINKKQLAISEEELLLNREQTKIAEETLDWDKEKFRIDMRISQDSAKATAELQKQLNANMVNVMGHMSDILEDLVQVTKHQHLSPMYREIRSLIYWLIENQAETAAEINVRNAYIRVTRQKLRHKIIDEDFDFENFYHVVDHVVQQMTRDCNYEAISNLTIQINTMFNLLHSILKNDDDNDESILNAKRKEADFLVFKQRHFVWKSIEFHLKKNWLINEPVLIGSQLCFEPYYRNTDTTNVCYDCKYLSPLVILN